MRALDRTTVTEPKFFSSQRAQQQAEIVRQFTNAPEFSRPPDFQLDKEDRAEIFKALVHWTFNKCAYCESRDPTEIDRFRPLRAADRGRGKVDRIHYCWLGTEWRNFFPVCTACNSLKANYFPIRGTSEIGADLDILRRDEYAQLLDPSHDDLSRHLIISPLGQLFGRSARGTATISLLNLNRNELLNARHAVLDEFVFAWNDEVAKPEPKRSATPILRFLALDAPYSGATKLLLHGLLDKPWHKRKGYLDDPNRLLTLLGKLGPIDVDRMHERAAKLSHPSDTGHFEWEKRHRSLPIRKLRIKNFKGIRDLELDFPMPTNDEPQWCAFVGANGVGKTSLLQALAIGLAGYAEASSIFPDARELLHIDQKTGEISIHFWHDDATNVVHFNADSRHFFGHTDLTPPVLGYGAYRLLARKTLSASQRRTDIRLNTLFDDHAKINGPHGWFNKLHDQRLLDAADVIAQLMLADDTKVTITDGQIDISIAGQRQPLKALSSGVQNVFSLATDILHVMYSLKNSALSGSAVILIDELDAHLHPAWRLKIVERLQAAFPMAQFFYTTHDPLTLRGMQGRNVQVLQNLSNGELRIAPPLPEIDNLFVDQLLTSDLFGLNSTLSPALDGKFVRYYDLLAKPPESLQQGERKELDELDHDLSESGLMGDSKRQRILYRVIDREIAKARKSADFNEWSEDSLRLVEEVLSNNVDYRDMAND